MKLHQATLSGADVERELTRMGISERQLLRAVQKGFAAHEACTRNHALTAAGTYMHHETLRGLRDELAPDWSPESVDNVEKTVSPDGNDAIVVWAGNCDTGLKHRHPCSKRPRGGATLKDVDDNLQGNLFGEEVLPAPDLDAQVTWVLLYHIDEVREEIRVELSVPLRYDHKDVVRRWGTRLILAPISLVDQVLTTEQKRDEEEYNVPVKRRGS